MRSEKSTISIASNTNLFKNCDISVISYQIARSLSNESEAIGEGLAEGLGEDGAESIK